MKTDSCGKLGDFKYREPVFISICMHQILGGEGDGRFPLLMNSDDPTFSDPKKGVQGSIWPLSQPRSWFQYFQAQVGVSAADSELGANRVLHLLGPTQRFPQSAKPCMKAPRQ